MRGQHSVTDSATTITEGNPYGVKRKMSHGIFKNIGSNAVYIQWTEESDALTDSNGFPILANETLSLEFRRENQPYATSIQVICASGESSTLVYSIE